MSPSVARVLARDGYDKEHIRRYLHDNSHLTAVQLERYAWEVGVTSFDIARQVRDGDLPPSYHESEDPNRPLPLNLDAGSIQVVVAGDPGRNQSKVFVNNHEQGKPVSRPVTLPNAWDKLRRQAAGTKRF